LDLETILKSLDNGKSYSWKVLVVHLRSTLTLCR